MTRLGIKQVVSASLVLPRKPQKKLVYAAVFPDFPSKEALNIINQSPTCHQAKHKSSQDNTRGHIFSK